MNLRLVPFAKGFGKGGKEWKQDEIVAVRVQIGYSILYRKMDPSMSKFMIDWVWKKIFSCFGVGHSPSYESQQL